MWIIWSATNCYEFVAVLLRGRIIPNLTKVFIVGCLYFWQALREVSGREQYRMKISLQVMVNVFKVEGRASLLRRSVHLHEVPFFMDHSV